MDPTGHIPNENSRGGRQEENAHQVQPAVQDYATETH